MPVEASVLDLRWVEALSRALGVPQNHLLGVPRQLRDKNTFYLHQTVLELFHGLTHSNHEEDIKQWEDVRMHGK